MRPTERHPATGASAPPDTLRQRSLLPSWPEAGKPFGDTLTAPRWPWPGVSPAPSPARRPRTGPQRSSFGRGPSPLCFYSLSHPAPPSLPHSRPGPPNGSCAPKALERGRQAPRPTQSQGQRGTLPETPSISAQSLALSPKEGHSLCLSQYSLSTSQPLSLRPCLSYGLCRRRLRETEHLPNHLNLFVGQSYHPKIFGTTANGTFVNVMETGD